MEKGQTPPYGKFQKKNVFFIESFPNTKVLNTNVQLLICSEGTMKYDAQDRKSMQASSYKQNITEFPFYNSLSYNQEDLFKIQFQSTDLEFNMHGFPSKFIKNYCKSELNVILAHIVFLDSYVENNKFLILFNKFKCF